MKFNPADLSRRDAHHVQMSSILPRPIAFVSTIGKDGVYDVAPYSSFMTLAIKPNMVAFSAGRAADGQKKRTLLNIESSREFVLNLVTEPIAKAMNESSATNLAKVDKFKAVGLTPAKADIVKAPMVAESPVNIECRAVQFIDLGTPPRQTTLIIAEVLLYHVKDEFYADGRVQTSKMKVVGRLGGDLYCRVTDIFEMKRPD